MLIISNGVPKSGSSYLFKLQRDLIEASTESENQVTTAIYEGEINGHGLFISDLNDHSFSILRDISEKYGPLVIKVHDKNASKIQKYASRKNVYSTFTYRDQRCFILSAMDHKERTKNEQQQVFPQFTNVTSAIPEAKSWGGIALQFKKSEIFTLKYEDLVISPEYCVGKVAKYLNVKINEKRILAVCAKEKNERKVGAIQFNKGIVTRYDKEMTSGEIKECDEAMSEVLDLLGYT
jgi:hypothetical protein